MAGIRDRRALVDRIERAVQIDVGRNITALFEAGRGGLWRAAETLAATRPCHVGLITGFFVPLGTPPAAETDGPVGTALLAGALLAAGMSVRLATDTPCQNACATALAAAGAGAVALDCVAIGAAIEPTTAAWRAAGVTHAISIERCGRSADGAPHNMRGLDISAHTAPFDDLFAAGPWDTIAVGDGGNEIGMGAIPRALIAQHVEHGDRIACVTPAAHLIVAGVSHWGAYALIGALAVMLPQRRAALLACLDEALDRAILKQTVAEGPAVDGVSRRQEATIDNFPLEFHHQRLRAIRAIVEQADGD
jgi:hypothetical protein